MSTLANNQPIYVITGASGFVGRYIVDYFLHTTSAELRLIVRNAGNLRPTLRNDGRVKIFEIKDLGATAAIATLNEVCRGAKAVFHLAARAHVMHDRSSNPEEEYNHHNVTATNNLAQACIANSVDRLIFLSSVKVNGEGNRDKPYREDDRPAGADAYARSKYKAEELLRALGREKGLSFTIIRPPLMYGPGVKANFKALVKMVKSGLPLPFGAIHNRRSMLFVGNLADALLRCAEHPAADQQTFLISDGADVSTSELVQLIATALNKRPRLVRIKPKMLRFICKLAGRKSVYERLCGDLFVDTTKIRKTLDWQPPFDIRQGLNATIANLLA